MLGFPCTIVAILESSKAYAEASRWASPHQMGHRLREHAHTRKCPSLVKNKIKAVRRRKSWLTGLFRQPVKRSAAAQLRATNISRPVYSSRSVHSPIFNTAIRQGSSSIERGMLSERSGGGSGDGSTETCQWMPPE